MIYYLYFVFFLVREGQVRGTMNDCKTKIPIPSHKIKNDTHAYYKISIFWYSDVWSLKGYIQIPTYLRYLTVIRREEKTTQSLHKQKSIGMKAPIAINTGKIAEVRVMSS